MHAQQLKLLVPRLRQLLARNGIQATQGQALEMMAAVPGLRNWAEVCALSEKSTLCDFDLDASRRLFSRISVLSAEQLRPIVNRLTPEPLMDELAPKPLDEPQDESLRSRLVVVSGHSAAGCMKRARIADRVVTSTHRFVWGPVPAGADEPSRFYEAWLAACESDPLTTDQPEDWQRERPHSRESTCLEWYEHPSILNEFERIELWMDQDPNSQLQLLQMLTWFGGHSALLERLYMVQVGEPLSETHPCKIRMMSASIEKVSHQQIELATRAWDAYRQRTPQAWAALLSSDLAALPSLRCSVVALLNELPATSCALRATELRILRLIAQDGVGPMGLLFLLTQPGPGCVFSYWEFGRLLDGLARAPIPAVLGLDEGPFDLEMHGDQERSQRYRDSRLKLSEFGQALVEERTNFTQYGVIRRWWGGTKLSNDKLWRWNASTQTLQEPDT